MASAEKPAWTERVVLYGNSGSLTGIVTLPAKAARRRPALVILNAGIIHKAGPNRMHVRLAREAAARGGIAFRFDFAGVGDCPARADGRPLAEGVLVDARETLDHLQRHYGVQSFVLVGLCSGADNALRAARQDERVTGVVLLDPTVHRTPRWYWEHYRSRLVSPEVWQRVITLQHPSVQRTIRRVRAKLRPTPVCDPWDSRPELFRTGLSDKKDIEAHLRDILERQVQLFYAISGGWEPLYNYREQLFDVFPRLPFGELLRLEFYPEAQHTFDLEAHRQKLLGHILDWLETASFGAVSFPRAASPSVGAAAGGAHSAANAGRASGARGGAPGAASAPAAGASGRAASAEATDAAPESTPAVSSVSPVGRVSAVAGR